MTACTTCDYPACENTAEATVHDKKTDVKHSYCRGHAGNEVKDNTDAHIVDPSSE
jgi:hypothetical protein